MYNILQNIREHYNILNNYSLILTNIYISVATHKRRRKSRKKVMYTSPILTLEEKKSMVEKLLRHFRHQPAHATEDLMRQAKIVFTRIKENKH